MDPKLAVLLACLLVFIPFPCSWFTQSPNPYTVPGQWERGRERRGPKERNDTLVRAQGQAETNMLSIYTAMHPFYYNPLKVATLVLAKNRSTNESD